MEKTELTIIRHGETDYNLKNIYFGHSNPYLNENGEFKSLELVKNISFDFDTIYSSDLERCKFLAENFSRSKSIKVNFDERLREINFGDLEGMNYQEALDNYGDDFENWIKNWKSFKFLNVESFESLRVRVDIILNEIIEKNRGRKILLITHSGVIRYILANYIAKNIDSYWNFSVDLLSQIRIDVYEKEMWILKKID